MSQNGTKIVLFHGTSLITLLRDDMSQIAFPNHWDLPGGGTETGETALDCVIRETYEEIGLQLDTTTFVWSQTYPSADSATSTFFAAPITARQIDSIHLGTEGQCWALMPVATFCIHPMTVPHFKSRVLDFWTGQI